MFYMIAEYPNGTYAAATVANVRAAKQWWPTDAVNVSIFTPAAVQVMVAEEDKSEWEQIILSTLRANNLLDQ